MIELDRNLSNLTMYLDKILKPNLYEVRKHKVKECPKCGCNHYIKYGYFKGIQRYKCKECGKTFSLVTNTICSYSKKSPALWIYFIELMLAKRTLKYCADKLKININTAFYWRHKILHAMTFNIIPQRLLGNIHMIKASTKENFKGNKHINTDIREKVFVVAAKGEEDSILCLPVCKKRWDMNLFNEKVYVKVDKNAYIVPYYDRYISIIAKRHNKNMDYKNKCDDKFISSFNLICKSWFKPFFGVATKYLKEYFCWFITFNLEKKFFNLPFFQELIMGQFYKKVKSIGI